MVDRWQYALLMAIEELLFFTAVPICGLLTLEAVRRILR